MVDKKQISMNRSVFIALMVILVLFAMAFAYLYGARTTEVQFAKIENNNTFEEIELKASILDSIEYTLDEVDVTLDNINEPYVEEEDAF